jgi:hypothetical protein
LGGGGGQWAKTGPTKLMTTFCPLYRAISVLADFIPIE